MNSAPAYNRSPLSLQDAGSAQACRRACLLDRTNLPHSAIAYEVEGDDLGGIGGIGGIGASVIVVDAPPGSGPTLHKHPYAEIFVVLEGQATFTAGEEVIAAVGGQVVVVPAGVPHTFVNSGTGPLRQVDIHPGDRFITEWLED